MGILAFLLTLSRRKRTIGGMEAHDLKKLTELGERDPSIKRLLDEHRKLDDQVATLERKNFLTSAEEQSLKHLKEDKLAKRRELQRFLVPNKK